MAAAKLSAWGTAVFRGFNEPVGYPRKAIAKGIREIADGNTIPGRIRRPGAGRKNIVSVSQASGFVGASD